MDVWKRLGQMMAHRYPNAGYRRLNAGATLDELEAAEAAMGVEFPPSLREAYSRFNGVCLVRTGSGNDGPSLFLPFQDWCDLSTMTRYWRLMRDLEAEAPDADPDDMDESGVFRLGARYHRGWLPVATDLSSGFHLADLAPGPAGRAGQLLKLDLQGSGPSYVAPSIEAYFDRILAPIEGGAMRWTDGTWIDARTGETVWSINNLPGVT